jgi:hypothetical protein
MATLTSYISEVRRLLHDAGVDVLQPVTGHGDDHGPTAEVRAGTDVLQQPRDAGGGTDRPGFHA